MSVKEDKVQVTVVVDGKQGISELGKLEMEANDLRHTMQGLKKDSQEYTQAAEQYKQVKATMAELREEIGLGGLTMKQMRSYAKELQTELDTTATRGTERYKELKEQLQEVNGAIAQQRAEVAGTSSFWSKISTEVKQFGMLAVGALGFQFVTDQIGNLIAKGAKLSDELADVQKTTGMTAAEVRQLNSDLSRLDTRTPTSELRKIAAGAGALGIAKEDVLAFTAATDKLVVSLGDEFQGGAEEITKVMGGLRNIFSDIKSENVSEDMLHIGNSINSLGAAGSATGPVVADFANRIGGVGITMGLTSGQVLGLSATLQELNVSTERGGTATVKILQAMAAEPAKFAKVAGLSTKEFTNLVNNDLYGALVKVTEGAAKSGAQATGLAQVLNTLGVDGAGASEVMAKLGANTGLLDQKVKLASASLGSTNSIMSEFSTKNDDLAGKLEKLTKVLSGAFTNSVFNDALESMVDGLSKLFGVTDEVKQLSQAFAEQQQATQSLEQGTVPLIARYEELKGKTSLTSAEQDELRSIIDQVADAIPEAVTQWNSYGKAMDISTVAAKAWIEQQRDILKVKNAEKIEETTALITTQIMKVNDLRVAMNNMGIRKDNGEMAYYVGQREALGKLRTAAGEAEAKLNGLRGLLAELKGEKTPEQEQAEYLKKHADFWASLNRQTQKGDETQLGLLEDIDAQLKALHEKQLKDRTEAEIRADEAAIKRLEKRRADLLGETKKTHDKLREQAVKDLAALEAAVAQEQTKLRSVDADADQQALNQVDVHYEALMTKARALSVNMKLTVQERRAALGQLDELADEKEEARENLKAEQAKKRAAEDLKFENEHALARANLRILLAKREEKTNPEEYRAALVAKIELERDIELQNVKLTETQRQLIIKDSEDKINAIKAASFEKQKALEKRAQAEIRQYQQQMLNGLLSLMTRNDAAELTALSKKKDKRLAALEQQKNDGLITAEQYEAGKVNIETEYNRKTMLLKQEQFEKERAINLVKAVMDGAMAGMKTIAELGMPLAAPVLPWIAAFTALQMATIISQPMPEFAEGGYTANGLTGLQHQNLSQSAGGMLPGGPFLATVNEVGEEYFVPHHLLQQPVVARSVEIIEAIRTGQTPAFAAGGFSATPAPTYSSPTASTSTSTYATGTLDQATALRLAVATERLNANLENPTPVRAFLVYKDVTETGEKLAQLKQDNSF